MANITYEEALEKEAADLLAIIVSGKNPDGTTFAPAAPTSSVVDTEMPAAALLSAAGVARSAPTAPDVVSWLVAVDPWQGNGQAVTVANPSMEGSAASQRTLAMIRTYMDTGTLVYYERIINTFKNRADASITAGTPVSIWTPTSGKKPRVMGGQLSSSVATQIIVKTGASSGAAVERLRSHKLIANEVWTIPPITNGFVAAAANDQVWLDVVATANVGGWIGGCED